MAHDKPDLCGCFIFLRSHCTLGLKRFKEKLDGIAVIAGWHGFQEALDATDVFIVSIRCHN
jgi:hypothetical protein